jgi:hypothetical protein
MSLLLRYVNMSLQGLKREEITKIEEKVAHLEIEYVWIGSMKYEFPPGSNLTLKLNEIYIPMAEAKTKLPGFSNSRALQFRDL